MKFILILEQIYFWFLIYAIGFFFLSKLGSFFFKYSLFLQYITGKNEQ